MIDWIIRMWYHIHDEKAEGRKGEGYEMHLKYRIKALPVLFDS